MPVTEPSTVDVVDLLARLQPVLAILQATDKASPTESNRVALTVIAEIVEDLQDLKEAQVARDEIKNRGAATLIDWRTVRAELGV